MLNRIQHKLKKIFEIKKISIGEIIIIDNEKCMTLIPHVIRLDDQIEQTKQTINTIIKFAKRKTFENIALNMDLSDPRSYFQFKQMVREMFSSTNQGCGKIHFF